MLLIDSSTLVKYYSREEGWERVEEYVMAGGTISTALIEFGNALSRKVRKKEVAESTAVELLSDYCRDVLLFDQNRHIARAFDISVKNGISFYDSLFIAVAFGEGCDLVSSDEKQLGVAELAGLRVIRC